MGSSWLTICRSARVGTDELDCPSRERKKRDRLAPMLAAAKYLVEAISFLAVSRSEEDQMLLPAASSWWSRNRDSLRESCVRAFVAIISRLAEHRRPGAG